MLSWRQIAGLDFWCCVCSQVEKSKITDLSKMAAKGLTTLKSSESRLHADINGHKDVALEEDMQEKKEETKTSRKKVRKERYVVDFNDLFVDVSSSKVGIMGTLDTFRT